MNFRLDESTFSGGLNSKNGSVVDIAVLHVYINLLLHKFCFRLLLAEASLLSLLVVVSWWCWWPSEFSGFSSKSKGRFVEAKRTLGYVQRMHIYENIQGFLIPEIRANWILVLADEKKKILTTLWKISVYMCTLFGECCQGEEGDDESAELWTESLLKKLHAKRRGRNFHKQPGIPLNQWEGFDRFAFRKIVNSVREEKILLVNSNVATFCLWLQLNFFEINSFLALHKTIIFMLICAPKGKKAC